MECIFPCISFQFCCFSQVQKKHSIASSVSSRASTATSKASSIAASDRSKDSSTVASDPCNPSSNVPSNHPPTAPSNAPYTPTQMAQRPSTSHSEHRESFSIGKSILKASLRSGLPASTPSTMNGLRDVSTRPSSSSSTGHSGGEGKQISKKKNYEDAKSLARDSGTGRQLTECSKEAKPTFSMMEFAMRYFRKVRIA